MAEITRNEFATPPVDVFENAEEILLVADVPGLAEDALSLELDRNELRIEGKRTRSDHGDALEAGRPRRDYRRVFTIPDGIDHGNVRAELKTGVLYVHLPKAPDTRPRKITVQAA
jgi:HSP20 family protein